MPKIAKALTAIGMVNLQGVAGISARALEFSVLTVARTGSIRAATWDQIDLEGRVWNIPAANMKAGRAHRVPLSAPAIELLEALPRFDGVKWLFPGRSNNMLSDMILTQTMRRMGPTAVSHGLRSTFSDWCAERTATPAEVREMALAHAIGDQTEAIPVTAPTRCCPTAHRQLSAFSQISAC